MLLARSSEPDARLPHQLGMMDLKDILKSSRSPSPPVKTEASLFVEACSPKRLSSVSLQVPLASPDFAPPRARSFPVLPPLSPRTSLSSDGVQPRHRSVGDNNHDQQAQPTWQSVSRPQSIGSGPAYHGNGHHVQPNGATVAPPSKKRPADDNDCSAPATKKKLPKWSNEENAKIIELRGQGMKWGDIAKHLYPRTEIGCRLHYQNYLEKRGEWDDERKTKLARVYERLKADMWQPIANELSIPWRAVEAMHWSIGEQEMARRANVTPFVISAAGGAGPPGEGNGRIAQAVRMNESTIYFEASDFAATENGRAVSDPGRPVSVFGNPIAVGGDIGRAPSSIGSGQGYPGFADGESGDGDGETDGSGSEEAKMGGDKKRVKRGSRGSITLPSISDLEGVSAWTTPRRESLGSNLSVQGQRLSRSTGSRGSATGGSGGSGAEGKGKGAGGGRKKRNGSGNGRVQA